MNPSQAPSFLRIFFSLLFFLFSSPDHLHADRNKTEGKIINPITDVCWSCLFPIHLGGVNVTPGASSKSPDHFSYQPTLCACAGAPPKIGVPLAFWEPVALIDVTRTPFKSIALGGLSLAPETPRSRGGIANVGESGRHSFYHVHYYKFPLLSLLELLPGFSCPEKGSSMDIAYLSELDPYWLDDTWSSIFNPEAFLFANPLAQTACIPDCTLSSLDRPQDELFWCAGCCGSLYPLMGHVSHHIGGIQASSLLVHRLLSKMHALGLMWGAEENQYCDKKFYPRIKKSLYKTQLTYPIAQTQGPCHFLGKSDVLWGSGKSYPYGGEDFVYLIWTKKHCCLDAVKAAAAVGGAP